MTAIFTASGKLSDAELPVVELPVAELPVAKLPVAELHESCSDGIVVIIWSFEIKCSRSSFKLCSHKLRA